MIHNSESITELLLKVNYTDSLAALYPPKIVLFKCALGPHCVEDTEPLFFQSRCSVARHQLCSKTRAISACAGGGWHRKRQWSIGWLFFPLYAHINLNCCESTVLVTPTQMCVCVYVLPFPTPMRGVCVFTTYTSLKTHMTSVSISCQTLSFLCHVTIKWTWPSFLWPTFGGERTSTIPNTH